MGPDKRESPRTEILGRLAGEVSVTAPALIRDISRGGAQIECAFPLILGTAHELRLCLGDDAIVVRARVAHCQIADIGRDLVRYVAGVEFVELPPHAEAAIAAYLDRVRREREPLRGSDPT
ncbi:MAG: PilZ domain-containing protein [Vicinamibacterales bacterium]